MLTVGISALALSRIHPNNFLFIVGVFTIYLASTGERYLFLKKLNSGQQPHLIDWLVTGFMMLFSLVFIGVGIYYLSQGNNLGIVLIVFGLLGLKMVSVDFRNYRGKSKILNYWLTTHLQRMIGAYIAALTAFLVVNLKYMRGVLPDFIVWLLPTLILVPLIFKWTKKYKVVRKQAGN